MKRTNFRKEYGDEVMAYCNGRCYFHGDVDFIVEWARKQETRVMIMAIGAVIDPDGKERIRPWFQSLRIKKELER